MPKVIESLDEWYDYRSQLNDKTLGCVPTMGNLHQGHGSLIKHSVNDNTVTVLTIFVNPTQFNQESDLVNYPRTLENDLSLAKQMGVDAVFLPTYELLYPDHYTYRVSENSISNELEGQHRPGHFDGVLSVVMKLLNIIKPHKAYFGEKDYQQLQLIQGMVEAFFMDVKIIPCPTVRNDSGLALSSRNSRLTEKEKKAAEVFPQLLSDINLPDEVVAESLSNQGFRVDYITTVGQRRFGAAYLGDVRLIDNVIIHNKK